MTTMKSGATAAMKWKVVAAAVAVAVLIAAGAAGQGSVATDREALEAFYYAASGPDWTNNDGWLAESSWGSWYGVTIIIGEPVGSGRVRVLRLIDNNLSGPVVADLSRLHYLRGLNLSENDLRGSIPAELGQLDNLGRLTIDATTGLCLPADFPDSPFATLARDSGVPDFGADDPTLPARLTLSATAALAEGGPTSR